MPEPIRTLIVDDEPLGRELVRHLLGAHPDFHVIAECANGEQALAALKRHAPQLVFLDIKMPRLDGMELLQRLEPNPQRLIVFVTAHDRYALQAFEAHAFDYLLKPFDADRFAQALARIRARLDEIAAAQLGQSVRHFLTTAPPLPPAAPAPAAPPDRIVIRESGRVTFVSIPEIEWLEASGNYVGLHVAGGKTHLVHDTMANLEARLDPARFVRIHRSAIVRIDRIKELQPHFNGEYIVILKDDAKLKLSRSYLETARAALGLG